MDLSDSLDVRIEACPGYFVVRVRMMDGSDLAYVQAEGRDLADTVACACREVLDVPEVMLTPAPLPRGSA